MSANLGTVDAPPGKAYFFDSITLRDGAVGRAIVPAGVAVAASLAPGAANAAPINSVFVIAMENHNWTQPVSDRSAPHQILNNTNAPFINSIVNFLADSQEDLRRRMTRWFGPLPPTAILAIFQCRCWI